MRLRTNPADARDDGNPFWDQPPMSERRLEAHPAPRDEALRDDERMDLGRSIRRLEKVQASTQLTETPLGRPAGQLAPHVLGIDIPREEDP